ncbi:unnamed protein product [Zymoseptoria tritici ST99CH_1E4]|uniref:Uncharacterized protein n=1 Tax=Zymoseptoria tritici ST99CH_1E4 TaxID=1276532 RepID=A0A2H1FJN8_ZYMTR|nr:unnamed protein product [Zymoseptoria tritici ST99CH_1E4]
MARRISREQAVEYYYGEEDFTITVRKLDGKVITLKVNRRTTVQSAKFIIMRNDFIPPAQPRSHGAPREPKDNSSVMSDSDEESFIISSKAFALNAELWNELVKESIAIDCQVAMYPGKLIIEMKDELITETKDELIIETTQVQLNHKAMECDESLSPEPEDNSSIISDSDSESYVEPTLVGEVTIDADGDAVICAELGHEEKRFIISSKAFSQVSERCSKLYKDSITIDCQIATYPGKVIIEVKDDEWITLELVLRIAY